MSSTVRLLTLQHKYFWSKNDTTCRLCASHSRPTLTHILCECAHFRHIRSTHDLPSNPALLRLRLLTMNAKSLYRLAEDTFAALARPSSSPPTLAASHQYPHSPIPTPQHRKEIIVRWDGSYGTLGAGLGITVEHRSGGLILEASVPVHTGDATRCEALGPALASLLISRLGRCDVWFEGDSAVVCRLLRKEILPTDVWLYNATSITLDMLGDCNVEITWIPRDLNGTCDALARKAVQDGHITLLVAPDFRVAHER